MFAFRQLASVTLLIPLLCSCSPRSAELIAFRGDWTVMGTSLDIVVYRPNSDGPQAAEDLDAAFNAIAEIDRLMSLYSDHSELSRLNADSGAGAMPVSAHTIEVLRASNHYAELSNEAFDVTSQPLIELWGFYQVRDAKVPSSEAIDTALTLVGRDRVTLDESSKSVSVRPGTQLDFGAIAKGYAVDLAIEALRKRNVPAALVNLGGMVGVFGHAPGDRPWVIGIRHPRDNKLIGEVRVEEGAVATSGDYDRYFISDGKRYSHIIDPRTGWPVEGLYAVTVVAPNAMMADALSTAAFVLGPEQGLILLAACKGVSGMVIEPVNNSIDDGEVQEALSVYVTPHSAESNEHPAPFIIDDNPTVLNRSQVRPIHPSEQRDCLYRP